MFSELIESAVLNAPDSISETLIYVISCTNEKDTATCILLMTSNKNIIPFISYIFDGQKNFNITSYNIEDPEYEFIKNKYFNDWLNLEFIWDLESNESVTLGKDLAISHALHKFKSSYTDIDRIYMPDEVFFNDLINS